MKLTFDPEHNIGYIYLRDPQPGIQVDTVVLSDELNVDVAPDGTVYGIELLNASAQLGAGGQGRLVLVNEASHKSESYALP